MLPNNLTCKGTSLDAVILNATNPLVKHEDPSAVQAVVQTVCRDPAAAAAVAVRILAHKIHSPQQREAMKALSVVQACIINCGPAFHAEIGKFRFLNEMIKLVSPKFAGQVTSAEIKSRVLELLYCWSRDLTEEPKIAEAYNMLKKQSIVKEDPVYIGPLFASAPAPRAPSSTIEDSERSEQLQRLLQSKRPEDLDRANALIQAMVRDDQRRMERANNTLMELEMARNNVKVLDEMLSEHEQRTCDPAHVSLMTELHSTCTRLRNSLYQTIAQSTETSDDHMNELISVNEDLTRVMGRYKLLVEVSRPVDRTPGGGGVTSSESYGTSAVSTSGGEALLDLSSPKHQQHMTSNAATDDLVKQQLSRLGLADEQPSSLAASAPPAPSAPTTCSAVSLLQELDSSAMTTSLCTLTDGVIHKDLSLTGGLAAPLIPLTTQSSVPETSPTAAPPSAATVDPLTELSSSLLQSVLPPNAPSLGRSFAPPTKLSMNQMKLLKSSLPIASDAIKSQNTSATSGTTPVATLPAPQEPFSTSTAGGVAKGAITSTSADKDSNFNSSTPPDEVSLTPDTDHSKIDGTSSNTSIGSTATGSATVPNGLSIADAMSNGDMECLLNGSHETINQDGGCKMAESRAAGGAPSLARAQFVEVKPLADITVTIDSIQAGSRTPLTLIETGSVSVTLHYTLNAPRADVSVYVLTTTSRSVVPLSQYLAQACVPKSCRVLLLPPSATQLPQYSPFLPPPAITQVMLVANPNQVNVSLKLMLSYCASGDAVTEMAEVDNLEL